MADKKDAEMKQASTMLLCLGGSRDCRLLLQKVDQRCACGRTAYARALRIGSTGQEKQMATQPCNCYGSGNTLLDRCFDGHSDKIFDAC
eukprot:14010065-Ditylum_brightwellii.AAC.1